MIVVLVAAIVAVGVYCQQNDGVSVTSLKQQLVSSQSLPPPPPPRIPIRKLSAATVTSGYYVINVFSDSSCTLYVSQQTFLLNVCYSSSTSGQYNIGVLQVDSTSFSSFTVTSTTSLTSCTSSVTSGTNTPSSSYTGESCTSLSTGFWYKSTWSAFPDIVPPTSTTSNALQSGSIIKWYRLSIMSNFLSSTLTYLPNPILTYSI